MTPLPTEAEPVMVVEGDCLEVLPTLDPAAFAAVVTDPPYGTEGVILNPNRRGGKTVAACNRRHTRPDWDDEINPDWCRACCRVAPVVAWFGNWRRRSLVEAAMPHPIRAEVVWAKNTHVGPPCPLAMRDERIWLFATKGIDGLTFETSVWDEPIKHTRAFRHHRNEKPVRLMRRLIRFLVPPGGLVLDPFAGSGTTGVAAVAEGRRALLIEKEPAYCLIARKRIASASATLFAGAGP